MDSDHFESVLRVDDSQVILLFNHLTHFLTQFQFRGERGAEGFLFFNHFTSDLNQFGFHVERGRAMFLNHLTHGVTQLLVQVARGRATQRVRKAMQTPTMAILSPGGSSIELKYFMRKDLSYGFSFFFLKKKHFAVE